MQEESRFALKVDAEIKALAKRHNTKIVNFNIQQQSIRGTPDRLLCVNGMFVALELKKGIAAHRDPLQRYVLKKILQSGGYGRFVYPENLNEVLGEIESLLIRRRLL